MDDLGDIGAEAVAFRPFSNLSHGQHLAGNLRFARPLRLGALDRVDRSAVQGEARIAAKIRALTCARHRAENQLAILEGRLDPGDPR